MDGIIPLISIFKALPPFLPHPRSYAAAAKALGLTATVLLPSTAPTSRETLLKQAGVSVERMESKDLMRGVERHEAHGATFLHPFDCRHLIAGHASLGLELVEQVYHSALHDYDFYISNKRIVSS